VLILLLAGFGVGLVALAWAWVDLSRFPPQVWYWSGNRREMWRIGLVLGFLATGWPAMVVAIAWWRSASRAELRDEAHFLRETHRRKIA